MKIGILTNKYNIFLNLYLKKLDRIPKKDIFLIFENSKFPKRNKDIINKRLTPKYKNELLKNKKNLSFIKKYKYFNFKSLNMEIYNRVLKKEKINFFLNAGIMEIIKNKYLYNKIINIHPADLPSYRGCTCPEWTIYNNDVPCLTAHLINRKIDSGKIIEKKKIKKKFKNYQDFRTRLYLESINLGSSIIKKLYKKKKLKLYSQLGKGKYYKPIPNRIFKQVKNSFNK